MRPTSLVIASLGRQRLQGDRFRRFWRTSPCVRLLVTWRQNSQCQFVRNGSAYSAQQARAHLEKKQAYLQRKKLLTRTEGFIELAATQSSMSGKAYEIRCAAGVQLAGGWLEAELQRIRRNE
ncbi:DUF5329 family protein [Pseudomonas japonica]|uniref:DUF5329 family protein n=1 Tax=Pseudomonas japonica TaxID=256466 RepID=UPI0005AA760B